MVKLEEMRPLEIQDAASRGVPLLLPVGVLENHGHHNPCGLDLLCARGVSELVAERIEAVVAPALSYGPGVDAVGSPQMGSLEVGYKVFLPHAQAVLSGLVKMGFLNIIVVCHHQGDQGQEAQCMKLAAANLNLETPNSEHPHWWGELTREEQAHLTQPSIKVTTTVSGRALRERWAKEYWSVGHGGLHETAAILGLFPNAVDMSELTSPREDQPWFGQEENFGDLRDAATEERCSEAFASCSEAFGGRLVDAWAASLAEEVLILSGKARDSCGVLHRDGYAQPLPGRRVHCPNALQLDQMRPSQIQDAARRGVPVLLPIGVIENHGYHLPVGVDLVCARAVAELAAQKTEAIVAPPLSYGPGVDAVGSPQMGSLELGYGEYLPMVQAVLNGLVAMGFYKIYAVCQHQGAGGQLWISTELAAANCWIETPNRTHPQWWGTLPPDQQPPTPEIKVFATVSEEPYLAKEYIGGDHAGFWETSAILGCCEPAAKLTELEREDTPWFADLAYKKANGQPSTIPEGGAEWGREMIGAWAAALADKVDVACGRKTVEQVLAEREAVPVAEPAGVGGGVAVAAASSKARL